MRGIFNENYMRETGSQNWDTKRKKILAEFKDRTIRFVQFIIKEKYLISS